MIKYIRKKSRPVAGFIAVNLLLQCLLPLQSYALTSGPSSPEFSSFEPVATTNMVNAFNGDFNYNLPVIDIPGPDGGGYSMSLSYHSGVNLEEESSWVGLGWTLNPGALNRNMKGFPDDYYNQTVTQYNKTKPNWSVSTSDYIHLEVRSQNKNEESSEDSQSSGGGDSDSAAASSSGSSLGALSYSFGQRYNNYNGMIETEGFDANVKGYVSVGYKAEGNEASFSFTVNPAAILGALKDKGDNEGKNHPKVKTTDPKEKSNEKSKARLAKLKARGQKQLESSLGHYGSSYGLFVTSESVRNLVLTPYYSYVVNYNEALTLNPAQIPVGGTLGYTANLNIQQNQKDQNCGAYGYMYNQNIDKHGDNDNLMSDYYVEKQSTFNKRDYYLGMPFNNADNYILSGEGLSGGFRAYSKHIGHFYPNHNKSKDDIIGLGLELGLGLDIQGGATFSLGRKESRTGNWVSPGSESKSSYYQFQNYDAGGDASLPVFRFNEDMGGKIEYSSSTAALTAGLDDEVNPHIVPGTRIVHPSLANLSLYENLNNGQTAKRSSYIDYHLVKDMTYGGSRQGTSAFNKNSNPLDIYQPEQHQVAEYAITNEDGNNYVYGLPVYTRNEMNLQFSASSYDRKVNDYIVYKPTAFTPDGPVHAPDVNSGTNRFLIGERKKEAYASSYLLTQITTPDYVDIGGDGPDDKDYGGWTKFSYDKKYGGSEWFNYRTPYKGLLYNQNTISDPDDDMGFVSMGQKEVYYMETAETKSHIALFITNETTLADIQQYLPGISVAVANKILADVNLETRWDALGAEADPNNASLEAGRGTQRLRRLEKIVLMSKINPDRPIKTVRFEYDYFLAQYLPNNDFNPSANPTQRKTGKMTLTKVWFEYEGAINARISPYVFSYYYKPSAQYSADLPAQYAAITAYGNTLGANAQNPDYAPHLLDTWGSNMAKAASRHQERRPWTYQGIVTPADEFDPAAWNLKQIKLPSGGEIHIQYEQKDYLYVQDRDAMAMCSLLPSSTDSEDPASVKYYLNTEDISILPADNTAKLALIAKLTKQFITDKKRIYFKYLYNMSSNNALPSFNDCNSEYITGYATVTEVNQDAGGVYLKLGSTLNTVPSTLGQGGSRSDVPKQVCYDLVVATKGLKLQCTNKYTSDDQAIEAAGTGYTNVGNIKDLIKKVHDDDDYKTPKISEVCARVDFNRSFLRVPVVYPKKGGGIRVKRILMYDEGIENGDAALYGSEYTYETEDHQSSGVAVNEPSGGREENALVEFMARKKQSLAGKIIAGEDKKQYEGPIGETILPSASVGHSRVVIKNIHSGKSNTGFQIQEFFTAKDYPYDKYYVSQPDNDIAEGPGFDHTYIKSGESLKQHLPPPISAGAFSITFSRMWASQGFRFIMNNMHGQPRATSTYGGDYNDVTRQFLSSKQEYIYYEPGEKVKMLNKDGTYYMENPGKEMDVTIEMSSVWDYTVDLSLEFDIGIAVCLPLKIDPPNFSPSVALSETEVNTHTNTKVISYPAIVKSMRMYQDGACSLSENLAFNPHTGKCILTRTTDVCDDIKLQKANEGNQFAKQDGSYYSLSVPATWSTPGMGQKAESASNTNQLNQVTASITTYGTGSNPIGLSASENPSATLDGWVGWNNRKVISAQVQTFDQFSFSPTTAEGIEYGLNAPSVTAGDITALGQVYRPKATHLYKSDIKSANGTDGRIYNAGYTNAGSFNMYSWSNPASNKANGWVKMSEVLKYSPNGNGLEEINALDIPSAAKYGYNHHLPIMIAQNALNNQIQFKDFETSDLTNSLASVSTSNTDAHSGKRSMIYGSTAVAIAPQVLLDSRLAAQGIQCKLWAKSDYDQLPFAMTISGTTPVNFRKVATTGEWSLYEAEIKNFGSLTTGSNFTIELSPNGTGTGTYLYLDDIRVQPMESEATTYVYDVNTYRLLAQFDDQHFGMYYQYNDEGKLVRKLIETERGIKTLQETQYNKPLVNRK